MVYTSILITGATGNIGSVIVEQLLQDKTYTVVAAIRSLTRGQPYFSSLYSNQLASGQLKLVEVPDLSTPGVFDPIIAAHNISAILHIGTPLGTSNFLESTIQPAWDINENILTSAAKNPSVKRVIVTGSVVTLFRVPEDMFTGKTHDETSWNPITLADATENPLTAYQYSKVWSEQRSWQFVKEQQPQPGFDLVFLLAPSVVGKSIQPGFVPSKEHLGGIAGVFRELFDREDHGFMFPYFMDVEDVARHHVLALDADRVPGNERYLFFHRERISGPRVAKKIREEFPQLKDRVPEGADVDAWPETLVKLDNSKAEKVFGSEWKGWWESAEATVRDIVKSGV